MQGFPLHIFLYSSHTNNKNFGDEMRKIQIFLIGSLGYGLIEILWRGFTHPSMLLAGGICFLAMTEIANYFTGFSDLKKSILSSFFITAVEMIIGVIVNIGLNLEVWDYSSLPFNILGQISLIYSFFWLILSFIIFKILKKIKKYA